MTKFVKKKIKFGEVWSELEAKLFLETTTDKIF